MAANPLVLLQPKRDGGAAKSQFRLKSHRANSAEKEILRQMESIGVNQEYFAIPSYQAIDRNRDVINPSMILIGIHQ